MSKRKLHVGVLFRNNEELVKSFFYFMKRASVNLDLKFYVVDNASTDRTAIVVGEALDYYFPKSHSVIIHSQFNGGCSGGRNRIIESMEHDYEGKHKHLLIMDSDNFIISRRSLEFMLETLDETKRIGFVEGKMLNYFNVVKHPPGHGIAFCLIRDKVLDDVSRFDERFQLYYDDTMFMKEAEEHGWGHCKDDRAVSVHMWGSTITLGSEKKCHERVLQEDKKLFKEISKGRGF